MDEDLEPEGIASDCEPPSDQEQTAVPTVAVVGIGASAGGLEAVRLLLADLPADTGLAIVFVQHLDPTHESSVLGSIRYGGLVRLREKASGRVVPEPRRAGKVATAYNPEDDYMAEEFQQIYLARQTDPEPLGDRPLIVLGAGKRPPPPGTSDDLWKKLRAEKDEQVRDQASLSRNSKFILAERSGHAIQSDDPQLVAGAIKEVLEAVSKGTHVK